MKKVDLAGIVRHANFFLSAGSTSEEMRRGIIFLTEAILNRAGVPTSNYEYIQVRPDQEPGSDITRRKYLYDE